MSDIAIKVENLSKSYLIGHNTAQGERYVALRDVISSNAKNLVRKTRDLFQGRAMLQGDEIEEFWALKDINFEIKQGDRVGIIGRNGAGKSTLLKILSRITEPTSGRIGIHGRVASLLEVGTGFHPELTGRENIFLNGAILGMSQAEIKQKFDEIVDFAEVEKFLDTPVKRYSSGMYVRLAFAVAAHLEPEILIIDEVLSVGDVEFQKKCLARMENLGSEGSTLIFVTHNMSALQSLCEKSIFLESGLLKEMGPTSTLIQHYLNKSMHYALECCDFKVSSHLLISSFTLSTDVLLVGGSLDLNIKFYAANEDRISHLSVLIYTQSGDRVGLIDLRDAKGSYLINTSSYLNINVNIPKLSLVEGVYKLGLYINSKDFHGNLFDLLSITVLDKKRQIPPYDVSQRGFVDLNAEYSHYYEA